MIIITLIVKQEARLTPRKWNAAGYSNPSGIRRIIILLVEWIPKVSAKAGPLLPQAVAAHG